MALIGQRIASSTIKHEEHIYHQYENRINKLLSSDGDTEDKEKEAALHKTLSMYDPRHKGVWFGSKDAAQRSIEVRQKLEDLTDEEFQTSPYVLTYMDEIWGDDTNRLIYMQV